jgi:outer membrane immunogenic protein
MKKYLRAGAAVAAMAVGLTAASAADIQRRQAMPAKAVPYVAPAYNWTGFYVGINGGGGWGRSSVSAPFTTGGYGISGGLVGGTLGYNWQVGQAVFGLEGDIDWRNIGGAHVCAGTSCSVRNNWLGTVRGRLGYAFDRFLPYVTGGAAFGDVRTRVTGVGSTDPTNAGWTLGGGIEAAIAGPWTAKIEYLYVDLGHSNAPLAANSKFTTNIVRAGINYRF